MTLLTEQEKRAIVDEQVQEYWDELIEEHGEKLSWQEKLDYMYENYIGPASNDQISPSSADRWIRAAIPEEDN